VTEIAHGLNVSEIAHGHNLTEIFHGHHNMTEIVYDFGLIASAIHKVTKALPKKWNLSCNCLSQIQFIVVKL
jgi:hypothetical protein